MTAGLVVLVQYTEASRKSIELQRIPFLFTTDTHHLLPGLEPSLRFRDESMNTELLGIHHAHIIYLRSSGPQFALGSIPCFWKAV